MGKNLAKQGKKNYGRQGKKEDTHLKKRLKDKKRTFLKTAEKQIHIFENH